MAAAANLFMGQNQNAEYRAQRMADQLRCVDAGAPAARIAVINRQIFAEDEPRQLSISLCIVNYNEGVYSGAMGLRRWALSVECFHVL